MDEIRLFHFADLYVGMENYGRLDPASGVGGALLADQRDAVRQRRGDEVG